MANLLSPSDEAEALLVHIADPALPLKMAETLLQEEVLTIGRQAGSDLLVNERSVSRRHAEIRYVGGNYLLFDLGSQNGTFVNDEFMEPEQIYELRHNDIIRFGQVAQFRFLIRPKSAASPAVAEDSWLADASSPAPAKGGTGPFEPAHPTVRLNAAETPKKAAKPVTRGLPALVVIGESSAQNIANPPEIHLLQPDVAVTLGRAKNNDIVLADVHTSRRHAEVFFDIGGYYIRDLGSSYGVGVNGSPVDKTQKLTHGDRILLGQTTIFFVDLLASQGQVKLPVDDVPEAATQQQLPVPLPAPNKKKNTDAPKVVDDARPPVPVVICPHCETVNMPVARFCAGCSQPLRRS